jgi:site-specific DNA-methyltransferase (adenine-specific)
MPRRLKQGVLFDETHDARDLNQFFTPPFVATQIIHRYFSYLNDHDVVLEPACGTGAFLQAIEAFNEHIRAIGVEIDPTVAAIARENTSKEIITGDFLAIPIDFTPTCAVGNLPWDAAVVDAFLERLYEILPDNGRCGFLLPAHYFSLPKRVLRLQDHWSFRADHVPRYIYPDLSYPMTFAYFIKDFQRRLIGFELYADLAALASLQPEFKHIAMTSRRPWAREMAQRALESLGGMASLDRIYAHVERAGVPTQNPFWRDRLRESLGRHYHRVRDGVFSLTPVAA